MSTTDKETNEFLNPTGSSLSDLGELIADGAKSIIADISSTIPELNNEEITDIMEFMGEKTFMGNQTTAMSETLYGINHALKGSAVGVKKSVNLKSLLFIVRPQLNLRDRYLINDRKMSDLLVNTEKSINRFVRMMLDPRLGALGDTNGVSIKSPFVDNENPFISVLTNEYEESSGWPDTVLPTKTSTPGIMKEEIVQANGTTAIYGKFDLDISFNRIEGDPIGKLMESWVRYPSLTYLGILAPYYDFILANEYDYMTRIYRLLVTPDGRYVKKIASTGASFPVSLTDGAEFNQSTNATEAYEGVDDLLTVSFVNVGAIYNDPITVLNFNMTVSYFCPDMRLVNSNKPGHGMVMIPTNLNKKFNHMGKPRIDLETLELQFWIKKSELVDVGLGEKTFNELSKII